jgi:hypothetical protein
VIPDRVALNKGIPNKGYSNESFHSSSPLLLHKGVRRLK